MAKRNRIQGDANFRPVPVADQTVTPTKLTQLFSSINDEASRRLDEVVAADARKKGAEAGAGKTNIDLPKGQTIRARNFRDSALQAMGAEVKNKIVESTQNVLLEHPTDIEAAAEKLKAIQASLSSEVAPDLQPAMIEQFNIAATDVKNKIQVNAFNKARQEQRDSFELGINQATQQASQAAFEGNEPLVLQMMEEASTLVEAMVRDGHISPAAGKVMLDNIDRDTSTQLMFGDFMRAQENGQGLEFLENFIENPPKGLDQDQFESLRRSISAQVSAKAKIDSIREAERRQKVLDQFAPDLFELQMRIAAGEGSEDMVEKASQLHQVGLMTGPQFITMSNKINENLDKQLEHTQVTNALTASISGLPVNVPVDLSTSENKKIYDDFYNTRVVKEAEDLANPIVRQGIELMVNKTNQLPATLENQLESVRNTDNPDIAFGLADTFRRLPLNVQGDIPEKDRAFMMELQSQGQLMPSEKALERTREITEVSPDLAKRRMDTFREDAGNATKLRKKIDKALQERINDDEVRFPDDVSLDDITDSMKQTYQNQVESYIKLGVTSEKAAFDQAFKDMTQVFAQTSINGNPEEIMIRPPYTAYFEKEPEQMREIMLQETKPFVQDGWEPIIKSYEGTLNSAVPAYELWQRKTDGDDFIEERILNESGRPRIWIADPDIPFRIEKAQVRAAEVELMDSVFESLEVDAKFAKQKEAINSFIPGDPSQFVSDEEAAELKTELGDPPGFKPRKKSLNQIVEENRELTVGGQGQ